jgi:hypothetical protein
MSGAEGKNPAWVVDLFGARVDLLEGRTILLGDAVR